MLAQVLHLLAQLLHRLVEGARVKLDPDVVAAWVELIEGAHVDLGPHPPGQGGAQQVLLALAHDLEPAGVASALVAHREGHVEDRDHATPCQLYQDITDLDPGADRRAVGVDLGHQHAGPARDQGR